MCKWKDLAHQVLQGHVINKCEALSIRTSSDDDILNVMDGAFQMRKHYFGKKSKTKYDQ